MSTDNDLFQFVGGGEFTFYCETAKAIKGCIPEPTVALVDLQKRRQDSRYGSRPAFLMWIAVKRENPGIHGFCVYYEQVVSNLADMYFVKNTIALFNLFCL